MDNKTEDFLNYCLCDFTDDQVRYIKLAIKYDVDLSYLYNCMFNANQMREIVYGLIQNVDVTRFYDNNYTANQMEQIRLGLYHGVDVSIYASYSLGSNEMSSLRRSLEKEMYGSMLGKHRRAKSEVNMFDINVKLNNITKQIENPKSLDFDSIIQGDHSLDDLFSSSSS